jgi:hypothetical protein
VSWYNANSVGKLYFILFMGREIVTCRGRNKGTSFEDTDSGTEAMYGGRKNDVTRSKLLEEKRKKNAPA